MSKIGPILEENAEENDKLGRLNEATFAALKPLRMSHIFAGEDDRRRAAFADAGPRTDRGDHLSQRRRRLGVDGACLHRRDVGGLPARQRDRAACSAPGTDNRFSGQGTPTGMLKKVDGGYLLNGKWSYASGIYHATFTHTAALLDDGNGQPAKDENGDVIVLCAHAPVERARPARQLGRAGPEGDRQHRLCRQGCVHPRRHGVPDPDRASRSA